ncbi:MAG: TIGR03435 family protein [Acidobacteriota bacterium]|nr:TIGR03435 family protein [Acidobacteriota bacterium]
MLRVFSAFSFVFGAVLALAQNPPSNLQFEVATLKPSAPGGRFGGIRPAPGGERYVATNVTPRLILSVAWRLRGEQIVGGPGWLDTDTYDMNAKAEKPSSVEELHAMLVNLVKDRFKLKYHESTKEMGIYGLTVEKGGPGLAPHDAQNAGEPWIDVAQQVLHQKWSAQFCPMDYFAWRLGLLLDRPVVDRTGIRGGYDFELNFTRDLPPGFPEGGLINGQSPDTSGPNIFEAIRSQLGLKLESTKGEARVIVIDSAERPTGN